MTTLHPTLDAYLSSQSLSEWLEWNQPDPGMSWARSSRQQMGWLPKLSAFSTAQAEPRVIATHQSKEINLPVAAVQLGGRLTTWAILMVRDNFYDINVGVVSNVALEIDYSLVYEPLSEEEYQTMKVRAQAHAASRRNTRPQQWADDSWVSAWRGGGIVREDGQIWITSQIFAQGISRVPGASTRPYSKGAKAFTMLIDDERHEVILDRIGTLAEAIRANLRS